MKKIRPLNKRPGRYVISPHAVEGSTPSSATKFFRTIGFMIK